MKKVLLILLSFTILCHTLYVPTTGYAYEFEDASLIPQDDFDQGNPPFNYRNNFAMMQWCIYPQEHETYHDRLNSDYLQTVDELLTIFDIGKIPEASDEYQNIKHALGITDEVINVYKKNEINDIFNAYYGTNINLLELPNLYDGGYYCKTYISGDYFVFFLPNNGYINFDADAQWRKGNIIGDANYWIWAIRDTNYDQIISDDIHTITRTENVHGYSFPAIKYISFTPPSDDIIKQYTNHIQSDTSKDFYSEKYSEYISAMYEAYDCGYIYVHGDDYYGKTYKDDIVKYGQFADEAIQGLWQLYALDKHSNQHKQFEDKYGHCTVYKREELADVLLFKFGVSLEDLLRSSISTMLYADNEYIVMGPFGRGEGTPGAYVVVDELVELDYNKVSCTWHMENEWFENTSSDKMYAIFEKGQIAGKEIIAYKYLSVIPPSNINPQNNIIVKINGNEISFDQSPIIYNDRTLVPMRAIFEAMGCEVEWDDGMIDVYKDDENIMTLWVNDHEMWLPSGSVTLDVAPMVINDRTLVPVRAITESMGATVKWDGDLKIVYINYSK